MLSSGKKLVATVTLMDPVTATALGSVYNLQSQGILHLTAGCWTACWSQKTEKTMNLFIKNYCKSFCLCSVKFWHFSIFFLLPQETGTDLHLLDDGELYSTCSSQNFMTSCPKLTKISSQWKTSTKELFQLCMVFLVIHKSSSHQYSITLAVLLN